MHRSVVNQDLLEFQAGLLVVHARTDSDKQGDAALDADLPAYRFWNGRINTARLLMGYDIIIRLGYTGKSIPMPESSWNVSPGVSMCSQSDGWIA